MPAFSRVLPRLWPVALLLLALLSFGASWVADRYRELPGNPGAVHPDVAGLQRLVTQAAATAGREAALVALDYLPPADPGFARLRAEVSYPTFVNVDSVLVAWSAAGPEPTAADWANPRPERLAETEQGQFLVVRRALGRVRVLVFVPLMRHYGISNRYLRNGAEPALLQGLDVQVQAARPAPGQAIGRVAKMFDQRGQYLFSLVQEPGSSAAERTLPLALGLLGLLTWLAGWLGLAWQQWRQGRALLGMGLGLGALVATRLALLYLGIPFAWVELPLFDPRVYAVSNWAPSLGDLLLNGLLGLLLALGARLLSRHYDLPGRARRAGAWHWGPVAWLLLLGGLLRQYMYYNSTFSNSQLNLDVTQSIQVSGYRLVLLLAVVINTAAYVLAFLLLTELLAPDLRRLRQSPLRWAGPLGALLLVGLGSVLAEPALVLPGLLGLYLVMVRVCGLDEPVRPPGGRYLSVLLALGLAAGTGALAEYEQFEHQLVQDKQRLANNLLIDNDLQGEFLLGQRLRLLAADPTVARLLASGPSRAEALRRRISRQYLSSYFDKYEENIELFDPNGRPFGNDDGDTLTFGQLRERLTHLATPTDQAGVYLLKSDNSFSSRRYVAVVPVGQPPQAGIGPPAPVGTILLTLSLKQLASYSVLPELLVDQKFFQPGLATDLSYAGYTNGQLVYSQGEFDYANSLPAGVLRDPSIYNKGILLGGYHHLAVRGSQGRTVVVTTTTYSWSDGLSNFSVLLLTNVLAWLLVLGVAALLGRGWRNVALNFSTRIQLLLNIGVLLPLLVVSLATASQVTSSYRRDLHRFYERRGHLALESLLRRREQLADTTARPALVAMVRNVAALTETDLNLYDTSGQLLVSSQPLIFEAGLLGPLLNPQAVVDLRERGLSRTLLTERAGSLYFTSLYLPVRATEASGGPGGPVIAYVGIPFFDSQKELDGKLSDLITTTVNIFTVMFLLFLALALVATRQLTAPLKLLTQRLTRTTLTGQNEVLDYRSTDDEIGLLVREYNSMLGKLEESKRELAAQEKEAAWREMARQVAHEIKNPLTPMKLSLQYLQKAIAEQRPNVEELIGRISQTLITQVDVLSDIATSFSTFTNLPTMRPERLDVAQVLRECTDLFLQTAGTDGGDLRLELPTSNGHPLTVFADESLLVRTFNNLLLNARQAVPDGRHPHLDVALAEASNRVLITIRDNGAGIDDEVRDQIFKPNFTTKATGSGIGLAVAKRGIESAGGRIWFETALGQGTSFFIELPLAG